MDTSNVLSIVGPNWICTECISDTDIPRDNIDITKLTVWNGYMVCLYHLPNLIQRWIDTHRPKRR